MKGHIRKRGSKWVLVIDIGENTSDRRKQKWIPFDGFIMLTSNDPPFYEKLEEWTKLLPLEKKHLPLEKKKVPLLNTMKVILTYSGFIMTNII